MASLLEDLVQYIITAGLATQSGQDIWYDFDPDEPAAVVVLNEYDSRLSSSTGNDAGVRYVQITARNLQPTQAKNKAWLLYRLFLRPEDNITTLPNGRWCVMSPRQMPIKIRVDEKKRIVYGFNVAITTNFD